MNLNIGLKDAERRAVLEMLGRLLSDEYVLYTKTRNYHWNVVGPQFGELHKLFETQYEQLDEAIDEVAERARALGGRSLGSLAEFLKHARLKEKAGERPTARDMVKNLLADHETVIRHLRADLETCAAKYHDAGTSDFLTGIMESHEKTAWMLRSYLEGASV